jgi:tRNA A37 threonylcarbamoyladenosine dehydratase
MPSALPGDTGKRRRSPEPRPVADGVDADNALPRQQRRFDRTGRLLGDVAMNRLLNSHVMVFGVGGVGSFAVEALVRSGVGKLTLVDYDDICVTNANRQIHALKDNVGRIKVDVMAERCRLINPKVEVVAVEAMYNLDTADELLPEGVQVDWVLDAIDHITGKCHLLDRCRTFGIPVVSSMGAAARLDPTKVRVMDIRETYNDPFARDIRSILRKQYGWDLTEDTDVPAVFSIERPTKPTALHYDIPVGGFQCVCPPKEDRPFGCDDRLQIEGTVPFVTGTFGLAAAGVIVNALSAQAVAEAADAEPAEA